VTDPTQIQQDLSFVRHAIDRQSQHRSPAPIMWVVAIYVVVGYSMIDFYPQWANWFFGIGGVAMWGIMTLLSNRLRQQEGEYDRKAVLRIKLHWFAGISLAVVGTIALAIAIPALRGQAAAQVLVVMIGLVYFLGGIHFDRQFLWLGPVLMAGGTCVGLIPHYRWTLLGLVIALGLVVPTFFKRHTDPLAV
jgi:hypothetical protein